MNRFRNYEIEPVNAELSKPWRLVITVGPARTFFNLYWGDKTIPTHQFAVSANDWKEISRE